MAAIVDKLKKQITAQGKSTAGIQTISQGIKALGGVRKGEDIAKAVDASTIVVTDPTSPADPTDAEEEGGS